MAEYALQIVPDDEDSEQFRWLLLEEVEENPLTYVAHEVSECAFEEWADALNAGTLALAKVCAKPYENEAADPVGDAACAADAEPAPLSEAAWPYRNLGDQPA